MIRLKTKLLVFGVFLFLLGVSFAAAQNTQVAFEIPEADLVPEGIAFDQKTKRFFVSSTFKRKIVEVDERGVPKILFRLVKTDFWASSA